MVRIHFLDRRSPSCAEILIEFISFASNFCCTASCRPQAPYTSPAKLREIEGKQGKSDLYRFAVVRLRTTAAADSPEPWKGICRAASCNHFSCFTSRPWENYPNSRELFSVSSSIKINNSWSIVLKIVTKSRGLLVSRNITDHWCFETGHCWEYRFGTSGLAPPAVPRR